MSLRRIPGQCLGVVQDHFISLGHINSIGNSKQDALLGNIE